MRFNTSRAARANVPERFTEQLDHSDETVFRSSAFVRTDHTCAQALERGVVASLVGAVMSFTTTAALAEGPLKLAGSQLEPIRWAEIPGWL